MWDGRETFKHTTLEMSPFKKEKKMIEVIALLLFISLGLLMRYMDYKFPDKDK
jgi:hypothetical protein